jgi:hypothetical protein
MISLVLGLRIVEEIEAQLVFEKAAGMRISRQSISHLARIRAISFLDDTSSSG